MNTQLVILTLAWTLYGLLHSFFATVLFKNHMKKILGNAFQYYRLYYSLFATVSLAALLWYHATVTANNLWQPPIIEKITAGFIGVTGFVIMMICAKVYFTEMTGLGVFSKRPTRLGLVETGLHRYMRHPLYTGTLLFMWAFFVYTPSLKNLAGCGVTTLYILMGILFEEKKLVAAFGDQYKSYAAKTPMLIPRIKWVS